MGEGTPRNVREPRLVSTRTEHSNGRARAIPPRQAALATGQNTRRPIVDRFTLPTLRARPAAPSSASPTICRVDDATRSYYGGLLRACGKSIAGRFDLRFRTDSQRLTAPDREPRKTWASAARRTSAAQHSWLSIAKWATALKFAFGQVRGVGCGGILGGIGGFLGEQSGVARHPRRAERMWRVDSSRREGPPGFPDLLLAVSAAGPFRTDATRILTASSAIDTIAHTDGGSAR